MDAFLWWAVSNVSVAGLLAIVACIVSRMTRNPRLSHGLWVLVLIKLLMPPVYGIPTTWFHESASPSPLSVDSPQPAAVFVTEDQKSKAGEMSEAYPLIPPSISIEREPTENPALNPSFQPATDTASPNRTMSWHHGVVFVWGAGTIVCAGLVVLRCRRFCRFVRFSTPAGDEMEREIQQMSRKMGIHRPPKVFLLDTAFPPLLWGIFRYPKVLFPRKLSEYLSPQQRQTVLAHELAHLQRRDHLFRWIEVCALVVYWWCPIAWWASRRMRDAEEECCDALVLSTLPESRKFYGEALYKTIEFLAESRIRIPRIAAGTLGGPSVKRRIEMIMTHRKSSGMSWKKWGLCAVVALVALPIAAENPDPRPTPGQNPEEPIESQRSENVPSSGEVPGEKAQPPGHALPTELPRFEKTKTVKVSALLKPASDVRLSSPHPGTVVKVHVSEGDRVKKGQVLFEIKSTDLEIRQLDTQGQLRVQEEKTKAADVSVRLAQSILTSTLQAYERAVRVNKQLANSISESKLLELKASVEQAQLNLEKAKLDAKSAANTLTALEKRSLLSDQLVQELTIKAPIDGVIFEVNPQYGELLKANDPVARIVSLSSLMAEAYVSQPTGLRGQLVIVESRTTKETTHKFPAKVLFVSPITDPVTGKTKIRCTFENTGPNGQTLARPGQSAFITVPENPGLRKPQQPPATN